MCDLMPSKEQEFIETVKRDCVARTNMSDEEAYLFAFRCHQLGYNKTISKEQQKQIFDYGNFYGMRSCLNKDKEYIAPGTFPEDYDEALEFVYRFVIENERDPECLECGRYHNNSCNGTINRGRERINKGNRCGGYYKYEEEKLDEISPAPTYPEEIVVDKKEYDIYELTPNPFHPEPIVAVYTHKDVADLFDNICQLKENNPAEYIKLKKQINRDYGQKHNM